MMGLGERIRELRESKQMLQKELAYKTHVEPETISQWEHENRVPSLKRLPIIAEALGVSEAVLISGDLDPFLSSLGFTPDDLAGVSPAQMDTMKAAIRAMLTTFREQNRIGATMPTRTYSVCVVDDDLKLTTLLKEVLSAKGYEVEAFLNGKAAMDKLLDGYRPDCILLDIRMPKMDGHEFLRKLRNLKHRSKVVVISGHLEDVSELQANHVIDGFLAKPFKLEEVVKTVERMVG